MNTGFVKTFIAGASCAPLRIAKFDGAGKVILATADTDLFIGVTDDVGTVPADGKIDVHMSGQPLVEAGAAIAAGASVSSDASGKAKTGEAGDMCVGFAVKAAVADGDHITIHLCRHKL